MWALPPALKPLEQFNQFILWRIAEKKGKPVKLPVDPHSLAVVDAHDANVWVDFATASRVAEMCGDEYGIGFVFTANDPFFFLDIDNCRLPDNSDWSPLAYDIMNRLPGAAIEVSQSGKGLHLFGYTQPLAHKSKNIDLKLELYTTGRFVALTGTNCMGDAWLDFTPQLTNIVAEYFPNALVNEDQAWTTEPIKGYTGPSDDDDELLSKAYYARSAGGVFSNRASFADLWMCNTTVLSNAYPPISVGLLSYDASSADAALAQHLAFWTGGNCERIETIMKRSGLVREKWQREDYLRRTILNACAMQAEYYGVVLTNIADQLGGAKLRATSDAQRNFANRVREQVLIAATEQEAQLLCGATGIVVKASFWIDNKDLTPAELAAMVTPVTEMKSPDQRKQSETELVNGFQFLGATLQLDHFAGCTYVQDMHRVFTPDGSLLKPDQFNATYGGYVFQIDETGDKTTRRAWEAFTESQIIRRPIASGLCFRPALKTGVLIEQDGRTLVNTYIDVEVPSVPGDITPFWTHLQKVLPNSNDQSILIAYMAACVQHKGTKFQWAPLLQGIDGNGKTLFTRCVAQAVSKRYSHMPKANEIDSKFNGWLMNKLFVGVEDIYVPRHRMEVMETLKPMITGGDGLEIQLKGVDQVTADVCANFILNSNHKDAILKSRNDRRFAIFFTAQQSIDDIVSDGMTGSYFPQLYGWLREQNGYAHVTHYLQNYAIPDALNPATSCHRAPDTSSTTAVLKASLGGVEQEILEAVEEGRAGFLGGWISSVAVDRLLKEKNMTRRAAPNKRRELLQTLGYDWHPSLPNGRVNNAMQIDEGKKPRLFIKIGHIHMNLKTPAVIAKHYEDAQIAVIDTAAANAFGANEASE